jgi:hypothetical protein
MDPDSALADIREEIEEFEGLSEDNFVDALRSADKIVKRFKALDEGLSKDGPYPSDWALPGWTHRVLSTVNDWSDDEFFAAFGFERGEN